MINLTRINTLSAGIVSIFCFLCVGNVVAAEKAKGATQILLEEILVTGRKKSKAEELQDVPVAVTAVSGAQVEAMFASDVSDIGYKAPNVQLHPVGTIPNYANFFIRGMGINGSVISDDPAVGVIVDGMYLGVPAGVVTDTFDLQGVEVLRGPQGTLFGRNVTGGAVLLNNTRPGEEFGFRVRGIAGNDDNRQIMASVDIPLVDNLAFGRLTVLSTDKGDSFKNVAPGADDLGERDLLVIRPKLRLTPTDNLTITLSGEYGDGDSDPGPRKVIPEDGGAAVGLTGGGFGLTTELPPTSSDRLAIDYIETVDFEWKHLIGEVVWEFSDRSTLKSITAWRDYEQNGIGQDIDGSPVNLFNFVGGFIEQDQLSQEFIMSTQVSDTIDLTTGVYYFEQEYTYAEQRQISAFTGTPTNQAGVGTVEHDTFALFAQADILMGERWVLNLGGRITWESKDADIARRLTPDCPTGFLVSCAPGFSEDESWRNVMPKAGLQYNLSEDTQFYGSYTKGFRSGGFNMRATAPGTEGPYKEEKVDAFEVGMKTNYLDNRGRFNIALFYNTFTDLQRTILDGAANQNILNAGEGKLWGAELESSLLVGERLLFEASFSYIETKFDKFEGLGPDPSSLEFVRTPHWTSFLAATYDIPLPIGNLALRGSYSYQDESFADDVNTLVINSYELFDASATYTTDDGKWSVSLFGKNLADEVYFLTAFQLQPFFNLGDLGPRRSYGLSVTYEY